MSSTLRCISLLGCLLSVACSEQTSPVRQTAAPAQAPTLVAPREVPALTAASPAKPDSIVDAPATSTTASEPPVEVDAAPHEEPEGLASDRPVDPEEVRIARFVLATGVAQREPVGQSDVFYTDTKEIFAFVHLENPKEPYTLRVHWEPADGPASPYGTALGVPTAPRHRTWAWTRIKRAPGRYHAVLRTLDGKEIARREFLIEAAD